MFQQIYDGFVEGETYYVKNVKHSNIKGNVIFSRYSHSRTACWFNDSSGNYGYLLEINKITIYKYITKEEYYMKVKEKYDDKCLNIILKRLVNETFEWS